MTTIALKQFAGEIPNVQPNLLPDANSQAAIDCDFSYGDLRPMKYGALVKTMPDNVKGIYTNDGVNFMTWPYVVHACKGPVVDDAFHRVYFTSPTGLYVTTEDQATPGGGAPAGGYRVGVPAPNVAPALQVIELNAVRGHTGIVAVWAAAWYGLNGLRYDAAEVTLTTGTTLRQYSFTPPARTAWDATAGTGTPPQATLYCNFVMGDSTTGEKLLEVIVSAGSSNPVVSSAFPGGIEISLSEAGVLTLKWGVYETRTYVHTVYNAYLEESAPSPPAMIDVTYLQDVQVTVTPPDFTGYAPGQGSRIYRTFGTSATYFRVPFSVTGTNVFRDASYRAADVGVALPSSEWFFPPANMSGLTALPSGSLAAYRGNVLYMSEPYHPHAWPYSMSFPYPIRGICLGAQSLVVTTADGCYNVLGSHPKNMQPQKLPIPQAGISKNTMTMVEGGVAFLSPDGIVMVEGSTASMGFSQRLFSADLWRARYASMLPTMNIGYYNGSLVASSSTDNDGFIVSLEKENGALTEFRSRTDAMFYLPLNDTLYYSIGANLYRFATGGYMQMDWKSKDFILGKPTNFGAFFIRSTGSVHVYLYVDEAYWHDFTINGTGYVRLPAGKKGLKWCVQLITDNATIKEVILAESMGELRGV